MINFRDKFGQVDLTLIDPADVAKMSDEAQSILAIVIEAVQNREAAAIRVKKAEEATRAAMRAEADTFAAHQKANPAPTFLETHRASVASYNGVPEVAKRTGHSKHAKLAPRLAYEKACAVVADARTELQAAKSYQRHCELAEGAALAELIRISPPPSAEDVHREMIAKQNLVRAERVSKGLPAEEPTAPKVVGSPIDQLFAARAKNTNRLSRKQVHHAPVRGPLFKI